MARSIVSERHSSGDLHGRARAEAIAHDRIGSAATGLAAISAGAAAARCAARSASRTGCAWTFRRCRRDPRRPRASRRSPPRRRRRYPSLQSLPRFRPSLFRRLRQIVHRQGVARTGSRSRWRTRRSRNRASSTPNRRGPTRGVPSAEWYRKIAPLVHAPRFCNARVAIRNIYPCLRLSTTAGPVVASRCNEKKSSVEDSYIAALILCHCRGIADDLLGMD